MYPHTYCRHDYKHMFIFLTILVIIECSRSFLEAHHINRRAKREVEPTIYYPQFGIKTPFAESDLVGSFLTRHRQPSNGHRVHKQLYVPNDLLMPTAGHVQPAPVPNIVPVIGQYAGLGEKLLFGGGEGKFAVGPKDIIKFVNDVREKREQRRKAGSKTVKFISNAAGDLAGVLVNEASRKVGDLAGDIARFGVKEMTAFFISTFVRVLTHLSHLQTAVN